MPFRNFLAIVGLCTVVLISGLIGWQMHVPEGTSLGDVIYGDTNYLRNLAAGTSGQVLMTQGAGTAPAWANAALATSAGVRLSAGTLTLSGANPSTAATGLTTVSSCTLTEVRATAPGDEPSMYTYTATTPVLKVYQWRNTSGTDPTLVAGTDSDNIVAWLCQGT